MNRARSAAAKPAAVKETDEPQPLPAVRERLKLWRVRASLGAGLGVIILPALLFTPLIPYIDMVAFAYLHSYPAKASYGPQHYYLFEFTYILQHMLSRAAADLGIGPRWQVLFFYLAQALACYGALSCILLRFVRQEFLLCLGLLFAPLAFSDGMFLWGGPLAYSLASPNFLPMRNHSERSSRFISA